MRKLNRVIVLLTTSDIFTWGFVYALASITGLYLLLKLDSSEDQIVRIVGIGTAIVSICRALFQIPIGLLVDKLKTDKDDILVLAIGNLLMGFPITLYVFITTEYFFYILQACIGFGTALNLVTWRKLFANNLDKGKEGLQYASYDTVMSLSIAVFSATAGFLASEGQQYFDLVILAIGIMTMTSTIWPILLFTTKRK